MASAAVIEALRPLDTQVPAGELLNALDHAVRRANSALSDILRADPSLRGMGTTLTALLWSGSQLGLVHIGDSRAYLIRDGEMFQITQDHTLVQSLLDDGKITAEEVSSHPQRFMLLRALDGGNSEPDLQLREARPGDRYLLGRPAPSSGGADVHSAVPVTPRSIGHAAACDERMGNPARKHAGLTQRGTCLVTPGHRAGHGHDRARTKHRAAAARSPARAIQVDPRF